MPKAAQHHTPKRAIPSATAVNRLKEIAAQASDNLLLSDGRILITSFWSYAVKRLRGVERVPRPCLQHRPRRGLPTEKERRWGCLRNHHSTHRY